MIPQELSKLSIKSESMSVRTVSSTGLSGITVLLSDNSRRILLKNIDIIRNKTPISLYIIYTQYDRLIKVSGKLIMYHNQALDIY